MTVCSHIPQKSRTPSTPRGCIGSLDPKTNLGKPGRYYWARMVPYSGSNLFNWKVPPPLTPLATVSFMSSTVRLESQIVQFDPLRTRLSPSRILPPSDFPNHLYRPMLPILIFWPQFLWVDKGWGHISTCPPDFQTFLWPCYVYTFFDTWAHTAAHNTFVRSFIVSQSCTVFLSLFMTKQ